jgi:zinc protease
VSLRLLIGVLLALLVAPADAAAPALDTPIPSDPRIVTDRLDNGFSYIVRRHPTAERRIGIWLHVATGSLNETETTRGIAHYLEHLAFNGSANFPPGALVPFFESIGLTFGRDQNAFTTLEQTTYQIVVPAGNADALDKAVLFMSDVAGRLDLTAIEVERERQIILEEKRVRAGASQRVQDQVIERLAPESTLGRRMPIGTEATLRKISAADLRAFYAHWYVPSNMTLIVVGDTDPAAIGALVARHFGSFPPAPRPAPLRVGVAPTKGARAILATDPELTHGDVSLTRVSPPRPPSLTIGDYRREIVESFGPWIVSRRLDIEAAEGRARFESGSVSLTTWTGAMRMATVRASGRPEKWREMLEDLGQAVQRARLHGVTAREVEQARRATLSEARDAVLRDTTAPIRSVIAGINRNVAQGEPTMSAAQRLALLEQLLPTITAAEVSAAFAADFDPANVVTIARLPSAPRNPTEGEVARVGRRAVDVTPAASPERAAPAALLDSPPRAGTIVADSTDAVSAVTSVWLDNGVRAHHRAMDQQKGDVFVEITLAGGTIQETAATRGLTEAAAEAFAQPATSRRTSIDVRDLLTGTRIDATGNAGEDALTLTIRTTPHDLETAFQVAYLLLTDPVIEPSVLLRWRESAHRRIARRTVEPTAAVQHAVAEALAPATESRMRPLDRDRVDAVTRDAVNAWLARMVTTAPIEAAIVGDVDRARTLDLVTRYLGALPRRDRIGPGTLASLRRVTPPPGPLHITRTIDTRTEQAAVITGFRGADLDDRIDARRMTVAARILSSRMRLAIREQRQLVYSISAMSRPGVAYPGFGVFVAQAPTDPKHADALIREIEAMYAHFAAEGPTETEIAVARRQVVAQVDQQLQQPRAWADRLGATEYRGRSPRDLLESRADYERIDGAQVLETFRKYWRPESRFSVLVAPGPAALAPAVPAGDGSLRPVQSP